MGALKNKTIFITGATRGIGEAIALKCAKDGANIVVIGKTDKPHPQLPGTIHTVAEAVEKVGGNALPICVDARDESQIQAAVDKTIATFGGIDILINNCSAISLTPTLQTEMKRFDLMFGVNVRATFATSKACLPHLLTSDNPHILTMSPPLNMQAKWFKDHLAYTMSKYGMSMCTLGLAEEFKGKVAVNSLWPRTTIATAAVAVHFPKEILEASRKPAIVADAAYEIVTQEVNTSGNFFVDEEVLKQAGVNDFDQYALNPGSECFQDIFLD